MSVDVAAPLSLEGAAGGASGCAGAALAVSLVWVELEPSVESGMFRYFPWVGPLWIATISAGRQMALEGQNYGLRAECKCGGGSAMLVAL